MTDVTPPLEPELADLVEDAPTPPHETVEGLWRGYFGPRYESGRFSLAGRT